jgi:RNA polymerase sigma-70 factor, ECF subfamily
MNDPSIPYSERVNLAAQRLAREGMGALGALYDLTASRLLRYSVTITGNQHDAEDAVQASLTQFGLRPTLLSQVKTPWGYLLGTVRNESLRIRRTSQRVRNDTSLIDLRTICHVDEVEADETHRMVWRALRGIPSEQAEVIVLKIWEQMRFEAISELLQISPHTAASRYQYGLRKLAAILHAEDREVVP